MSSKRLWPQGGRVAGCAECAIVEVATQKHRTKGAKPGTSSDVALSSTDEEDEHGAAADATDAALSPKKPLPSPSNPNMPGVRA
jgi:hypothetical protein